MEAIITREIETLMKKNILFLHPNFPGQFKHIAKHLANKGHEVVFMCQTHYGRTIKNIKLLTLKGKCGEEALNALKLKSMNRCFKLADQYHAGFIELDKTNWKPDIIISHSGWGCGAYAKQHWPDSYKISYLEWWFNPKSTVYTYNEGNALLGLNKNAATQHWLRNALISLELVSADTIVSPTKWQKDQLPNSLRDKCNVIFDGIDQKKFFNIPKKSISSIKCNPIVTYGTRGMEPMRCFPEFIQCLPALVRKIPGITIQIAGNDEINYGGKKPPEGSWKIWAKKYLQENSCAANVKWIGRLDEKNYISWLQNSDCHVYLTHPYVASWSLVEAIFCCDKIVASDVDPVKEFNLNSKVELVDHRNQENIVNGILRQLNSECGNKSTGERNKRLDSLTIDTCMSAWEGALRLDVKIEQQN